MPNPAQSFDHRLNPTSGYWAEHALLYTADKAASESSTIYSGMCAHVHTDGDLKLGVSNYQMGLFVLRGENNLETKNDGGTLWYSVRPKVNTTTLTTLVATGGYEMETSEFDTAQTYVINQLLRGHTDGKLTNKTLANGIIAPYSTSAVCGVVSRAVYTDSLGGSKLPFWSVYLPASS